MTEPTITCPNCKTEIKLTESLAAPLIESTRRDYEQRLAKQNADIAKREEALSKAKDALDDQVAEKVIQQHALKSRDLRYKKGALWVYHLGADDNIARQLKRWGFKRAAGKGYWLV
jgi:hypothetical protein